VFKLYELVIQLGQHIQAGRKVYQNEQIKYALVACSFLECHHGARGGNWVLGRRNTISHTIESNNILVYVQGGERVIKATETLQLEILRREQFNAVEYLHYIMPTHKGSSAGEQYIINYRTGAPGERRCVELVIGHAINAELPEGEVVPFFSLPMGSNPAYARRSITTEMLSHTAKFIAGKFDLPHNRFGAHSFRHCTKTELVMQGVHELDSRRVLGHTATSTSAQLYDHAPVNMGALTYTRNPGLSITDIRHML